MTISESLVASCLLLSSLAGSLQVWGASVGVAVAEESRQELRERVEAELMATEARLRRHGEAMPESSDCVSHGQALGAALAAHPLPEGLRRKVATTQEGLVQVEVGADRLAEPARRRLWSPAAFGLCGAAAAAPLVPLVLEVPDPLEGA